MIAKLIAVLLTTMIFTSAPAGAGEIRDHRTARTEPETVQLWEVRAVTRTLLRDMIGPAVTHSVRAPVTVATYRCWVDSPTGGVCRGEVVAGRVTCRGTFRVRKFPEFYNVWPRRMTCTV